MSSPEEGKRDLQRLAHSLAEALWFEILALDQSGEK